MSRVALEAPVETFSTSIISWASSPARAPMAMPSAVTAMVAQEIRLLTSFMVWPAPGVAPMKNSLPMMARMDSYWSKLDFGPPTITDRVPSRAPFTPPDTGASSEAMSLAARPSATMPETFGPVVERSTKVLIFSPRITPSGPSAVSWTMAGLGRLASTSSAASAHALGEAPRVAPRAVSGSTAASLTSNTTRVWPASINRPAMRPPMRPSPMKPICMILASNVGVLNYALGSTSSRTTSSRPGLAAGYCTSTLGSWPGMMCRGELARRRTVSSPSR